jgi:hypothetical protein
VKLLEAIDKKKVSHSLNSIYDLSNRTLYDLCSENFEHDTPDKILAKTVIIGRTYAVALDRGKDKNKETAEIPKYINDDFYLKKVTPLFLKSKIDNLLLKLKSINQIPESPDEILAAHFYLMDHLKKINKQDKRSFCSKYLHFHLPGLFFIYDSRAQNAINKIVSSKGSKSVFKLKKQDETYAKFVLKALFLRNTIYKDTSILLTPRQLDNYLLTAANEHLRYRLSITKK